jgi:preprotein translocase subunit SecA
MLKNFVKLFSGDPTKKTVDQYRPLVEQVNALEAQFAALSDDALRAKTEEFKARVASSLPSPLRRGVGGEVDSAYIKAEQDALNELMPEAFAAVREASKRTIGLRHYDVQIIGGAALHNGEIAEMRTGEGKTLVATMPIYLNSLTGRGVHLITVNDYLARRDARWMAPIYQALGLSVGVLQMAAMTENGKKAFIVDFERESPQEDQRHLRMVDRVEAYRADVTFGTNSEFGFDYLRDNMAMRLENRVQRGHYFAMVDEVDNVLIDEARTPLIISGPASGDLEWYGRMAQIVKQLKPEDIEMDEKSRSINLTEIGVSRVESLLGIQLLDPNRPEEPNPEQARLLGYLQQALRAQFLFQRNKDYLVQAGKVVIVDESTGRLMPGRRWSDGLHQAVEAKEGVKVEPESVTYATVTLQNYYRMYQKLAGMTGTALTEAEEFNKIYKLEVAPISPNLEYQSYGKEAPLTEIKAKDEDGYAYSYFAKAGDTAPLFFRRKDYPDVIYRTVEAKLRAIVQEIVRFNALGRPLLVGTTSVESSERLSNRLKAEPVRRLMQYMLVRDHYIRANNLEEDGRLIADLVPFNEPIDRITPDALRAFIKPHGMANISLDDETNLNTLLELLRLPETAKERLKKIFQGGVVHELLNAKRHTEESQIIAKAGSLGSVTIATNMAGRGVDIKLGGEFDSNNLAEIKKILAKDNSGIYLMSDVEIFNTLLVVLGQRLGFNDVQHFIDANPLDYPVILRQEFIKRAQLSDALMESRLDEWGLLSYALTKAGISSTSLFNKIKDFWQHSEQEIIVDVIGGLHVIGSERHEARRIDNQLRGRAARQGDPGSSRFYLSLEDDLMRVQGGAQVSALMERLKVDDTLPLEARLVANVIEQSQHRIEGANFDVRKHLLEYDDVLNTQRQQIYEQRNRIFVKEDLSGDVAEMLENEVTKRVEVGLADEEGPWRLLAWLDQVQPAFDSKNGLFPSYGFKLLLNEIKDNDLRPSTLDLVAKSIEAEYAHALRAIETLIEKTGETLETQISEREDTLDAFFQGLRDREDAPKPQKLMEEINGLMRLALRPGNDLLKKLADDPDDAKDDIQEMVASQLTIISATRVIGAIQNRLGEQVQWQNPLPSDWDELSDILLFTSRDAFEKKRERLNAQIARDIDVLLQREDVSTESGKLRLLITLAQGTRTAFDQKTHKQVKQLFTRFAYAFHAAQLLEGREAEEITDEVMNHLEAAEEALRETWGQSEFTRLSQNATKLADFGPAARIAFGEEKLNNAPSSLSADEAAKLSSALGKYVLNEVHRQLLLSAFSELWVEYLTKVEALRVSIGLEAYAQRDPLVQYKRSASEMFQQLLEEVRGLVISRAFAARPRRVEITPIETTETAAAPGETSVQIGASSDGRKKKRRRS